MTIGFFSRVGLIANACFLLTWLMRYMSVAPEGGLVSVVVVLGLPVSALLNVILLASYVVLAAANRSLSSYVPVWMALVNILFFVVQLVLLLK